MLFKVIEQVFLIAICCDARSLEHLVVIDLTHKVGPSSISWPGFPAFNFTIISRGLVDQGHWLESNKFQTAEHAGTHVDAPSHFFEGGQRLSEVLMERFVGPGVVINIKKEAAKNPDYRVTVDDVRNWESKYKKIPNGAVVIMNSGWHKKYPDKTLVFGSETTNDPSTFHFPGWHEDTADWLVNNRNVNVVGVDTPSTDYGRTSTFPVHILLGSKNITGAESVANLDAIPESGCIIYVTPVKLHDGSGAPARIFATCEEDDIMTDSWFTSFLYMAFFAFLTALIGYVLRS